MSPNHYPCTKALKSSFTSIRPPTPPVDPKVAELASRLQTTTFQSSSASESKDKDTGEADDEAASDDELFAELEKEDDLESSRLREKRMEALKTEYVLIV